MPFKTRISGWCLAAIVVALVALTLRTSGLFRGLESGYISHPDAPKQVNALKNFMEDRYVWYVGSLFYDGYPLGLNHVDEWILRPVLAAYRGVSRHLFPDTPIVVPTDKVTLYYCNHALRVFYGMLCLWLIAIPARRILSSSGGTLTAVALLAVAPLPIMVAHFATGDIGTDLFTLATLACLSRYSERSRLIWITGAGLATGLAFSCKYNGALAGLAIAIVLLTGWLVRKTVWNNLTAGIATAVGFVTGVIIGTPALLINGQRTWRDMRANFEFIQNYNVTPEFLAKPIWEQILLSVTTNTPGLVAALGWTLTILALAGLTLATIRLRRACRELDRLENPAMDKEILAFGVFAFPFMALLLSLLGKPEVQPFHFSYLQAPMILAATYSLTALWARPGFPSKPLAALLLAAVLLEYGIAAERDLFFWSRSDTLHWKKSLPSLLLRDPFAHEEPKGVIKSITLEPETPGIFRNRESSVTFAHAGFWNQIPVAPVPGIPLSVDGDWIFPNGPVFPRNDRMFRINRNTSVSRQVVFHARPSPIMIGLRSGSWPAHVTLDFGGDQQTINLTPNEQRLVPVAPKRWRYSGRNPATPQETYIVPLTVKSRFGNTTATVITTGPEAHSFQLYGGDITNRESLQAADVPTSEMIKELESLRYLDGWPRYEILKGQSALRGTRFPVEGLALPCGPYEIQCEIRGLTAEAEVVLKVDDLHECKEFTMLEETLRLQPGINVITTRFSKAFAPHEVQLEIKSLKGRCKLEGWMVIPDGPRIQADLQRWAAGAPPPEWLRQSPGSAPALPAWKGTPLLFADCIKLTRLLFPETIHKGKKVPIACAMEFTEIGLNNFQDYMVFIHMLDRGGHTVHQFHFPVWQAMAAGKANIPLLCDGPTDLPSGPYGLELGVYNARTEKRTSIEGEGLSDRERKKRNHVFGKTTLKE